jgi:epoxyqueuosine reductase
MNRERLAALAERHGLEVVGVAPAAPLPEVRERLAEAVAAGRMGRMEWMGGERPTIASDPGRLWPEVRSLVMVAAPYVGAERAAWDPQPDRLRELLFGLLEPLGSSPLTPTGLIARYAMGSDYHQALRTRLEALAADLRTQGIGSGEVAFVDDRPLAERAVAALAGIGWIGKNTNLLTHHRAGSYLFLGALLVSAELPVDAPLRSSCGSCRRCLDGCPTGALIGPRTIDARRCISYLTIEHPGELERWESRAIGRWIFGCDVCQEVCPVNADADDAGPLRVPLLPLGEWLLATGGRAFQRALDGTAVTRAGRHRLLRNVICALHNAVLDGELPAEAAAPFFERASRDRRPEVAAQAARAVALAAPADSQRLSVSTKEQGGPAA